MGERFTATSRAGLWPVEGLSEGSGALHETVSSLFPGPSCSAAGPSLGELEGSPEKAASYLTFHPDDHHTTDPWLSHFPNGPPSAVPWAEPTVAPTNS